MNVSFRQGEEIDRVFFDHEYVGYIQDEILYGFNHHNYAEEIGSVVNRSQAASKLKKYRRNLMFKQAREKLK